MVNVHDNPRIPSSVQRGVLVEIYIKVAGEVYRKGNRNRERERRSEKQMEAIGIINTAETNRLCVSQV